MSFVCLVPVLILLPIMAAFYHMNGWLQTVFLGQTCICGAFFPAPHKQHIGPVYPELFPSLNNL